MGFNLKKLLDEGVAQVNPFDNGATAATVRRPAAVQVPPAQTIRAASKPIIQRPVQQNNGNIFTHAVHNVENFGSKLVDQANPFDNNRTFKQRAPTNTRSVVGQATHNGTTNVVGGAVKFIPQFAADYTNTIDNLANKAANNTPVIRKGGVGRGGRQIAPQTIQQNLSDPITSRVVKLSGATGTNKQLAGDAIQVGLSAVAPGADKIAGQVGAKVIPKVAGEVTTKLVPRVVNGAAQGAAFNAASGFGEGHSAHDILTKDAPLGAAFGGALPIAGELAGKVAPVAKRAAVNTGKNISRKTTDLVTNKPFRDISDNDLAAANRVSMMRSGFPDNTKDGDLQTYRNIQRKLGADPNNHDAVDTVIGARQTYESRRAAMKSPSVSQGGYVRNPLAGGEEPSLPRELKGAKPNYSHGQNRFSLNFPNDTTKALYIVGGKGESARHGDYMDFLHKALPNKSEAQLRTMGNAIRQSIKEQASGSNNDALDVVDPRDNALVQSTPDAAVTPLNDALRAKAAKLANVASNAKNRELQAAEDAYINAGGNQATAAAKLESARQQIEQKYATGQPDAVVAPNEAPLPDPGDAPSVNGGKVKRTRFTDKTVQNSDQVSQAVKDKTDASYTSDTMDAASKRTNKFIENRGEKGALEQTLRELNTRRGTASRDTLDRAVELALRHDAKGDEASQTLASQLYKLAGEHASASGQQSQILVRIARKSPAGLRNKAFRDLKEQAGIDLLKDNSAAIDRLKTQQAGQAPGSPEYIDTTKKLSDLVSKDETNRNLRNEIQGHIDAISKMPDGQAKDFQIAVLQKTVAKHLPQGKVDQLTSLWKAGLLSGVRTHGGNIVSNATFGGLKKISDVPAAVVDKALSLKTGVRTKTVTGKGIAGGTLEGLSNAKTTLKTGIDVRNIGDKYEQHAELNFANPVLQKTLGNAANGVFRVLGAADQPFYYAALKNSLYDQAKADGINQGLSGKALGQHMNELVANPTEKMASTAEREANKSVLSYDTIGSKAISGAHKGIDNMPGVSDAGKTAAHAALNVLAPFVRVPSAFISRTVDFTPLGIPKEIFSQVAHKQFDQRAFSQAIGEGATGTGVIALGVALSQSGRISGDYPKNDPKEAARWKAQGITPNSVRIGNGKNAKWVSLNYLGPVGLLFNAGNKIEKAQGESAASKAGQAIAGLGQGLLGQSFLQGFSGFSDAIQDPTRSAKSFVNSEVSSVIPAISNDAANATDKYQRSSDTVPEAVKNRIPGLRETDPIKTDVYGNDLKQPSSAINTINPLRPSNDISNPVISEVARLHGVDPKNPDLQVTPTPVERTLTIEKNKVNLNNDQRNALQKAVGQATQSAWDTAIKSDIYKSLDDTGKAKMLTNLRQDATTLAQRQFVVDNNLGTYNKPVTNRQAGLGTGNIDLSEYVGSDANGSKSYVKGDDRGTALLAKIGSLSTDQQKAWATKSVDPKYKDLYDRSKQLVPDGLPDLPQTNSTLTAYGKYIKAKAANPTPLELNNAKKTFLKDAYGASLSKNSQDLLGSFSVADKIAAARSGAVSKQDLNEAVAYDNMLLTSGLSSSPKISNKLRASLGYADAPSAAGSSASGVGSKKNYDIYSGINTTGYERKLRNLVAAAHI